MNPIQPDPKSQTIDVLVAMLLLVPLVVFGAWTLSVVWGWYAPILSPALPLLTYKQAFAVRALIGFISPKNKAQPGKSVTASMLAGVSTELVFMFFLWLIWLVIR